MNLFTNIYINFRLTREEEEKEKNANTKKNSEK